MLSEHITVVDVDARHWRNLLQLRKHGREPKPRPDGGAPASSGPDGAKAPAAAGKSGGAGGGTLLVAYEGDRVVKALHSARGVLFGFQCDNPRDVKTLAERERADVVWAVEVGALEEALALGSDRVEYDMDYVEQLLRLTSGLSDVYGRRVFRWPDRPFSTYHYDSFLLPWRLAFPNGRTALLYVFDGPASIWTSAIVRKNGGKIDLFTTHDTLVAGGFRLTDWRTNARAILTAVKRKWGKPYVGLFASTEALAALNQESRFRETFRDLRARGEIVVRPDPLRLRLLLALARRFGR